MDCVRAGYGVVVAVSFLWAFQAGATPTRLVVTDQQSPPSTRTISFEELVSNPAAPSLRIDFEDHPKGPIELFKASATLEERLKSACRLEVAGSMITLTESALPSDACRTLLKPLFAGEAVKLAVSKPQSSIYALLVYEPPEKYAGLQAPLVVKFKKDQPADWSKAIIPAHVARTQQLRCYVRVDRWHELDCAADGKIDLKDAQATVDAVLIQEQALKLIVQVKDAKSSAGAWRSFELKGEWEKAQDTPPVVTTLEDLDKRCLAIATALPIPPQGLYVMCADAIPEQSGVVTLACTTIKEASNCEIIGDVLRSGRNTVVYAWSPQSTAAKITFGGTPGFDDPIYRPDFKSARLGGMRSTPSSIKTFGSRKSGTAELQVTSFSIPSDADKPPQELFQVKATYTVEAYYRWALRLGIGATWAPWSREFGVRQGDNNELYSAVLTGGDSGTVTTGVVAGLTYFCEDIQANSAAFTWGVGGRLGVVGQTGSNNVRFFDSLMVGPELAIGTDFSVGIFGGLVLDSRPKAGFEVGKVLPRGTTAIQTQPGIAPGFSIAFNFTPGFLKSAGMVP